MRAELAWRKDYPKKDYQTDEGILCLELHTIDKANGQTLDIRVIPITNIIEEYGARLVGS